jgi:hypothetical protein
MSAPLIQKAIGILLALSLAALGTAAALFPQKVNRLRMQMPGQMETSDGCLQKFGLAMAGFTILCAIGIAFARTS